MGRGRREGLWGVGTGRCGLLILEGEAAFGSSILTTGELTLIEGAALDSSISEIEGTSGPSGVQIMGMGGGACRPEDDGLVGVMGGDHLGTSSMLIFGMPLFEGDTGGLSCFDIDFCSSMTIVFGPASF